MTTTDDLLTTVAVARAIPGAARHHVVRCVDRLEAAGKLSPVRAGLYRLVRQSDVPIIREWLESAGWIAATTAK